jgi:putative flippase GtrA
MRVMNPPDIQPDTVTIRGEQSIDQAVEGLSTEQHWRGRRFTALRQLLRFGLVGILNTIGDLLIFNMLLLALPSKDNLILLLYNTVAYGCGAFNSFLLNKYWTFHRNDKVRATEIGRFIATTLVAIGCNNGLLWLASNFLRAFGTNAFLTANVGKIIAILGTMVLSYGGMRLWVFTRLPQGQKGGNQ